MAERFFQDPPMVSSSTSAARPASSVSPATSLSPVFFILNSILFLKFPFFLLFPVSVSVNGNKTRNGRIYAYHVDVLFDRDDEEGERHG